MKLPYFPPGTEVTREQAVKILERIFSIVPTDKLHEILETMADPAHKAETLAMMKQTSSIGAAYDEDRLEEHAGLVREAILAILAARGNGAPGETRDVDQMIDRIPTKLLYLIKEKAMHAASDPTLQETLRQRMIELFKGDAPTAELFKKATTDVGPVIDKAIADREAMIADAMPQAWIAWQRVGCDKKDNPDLAVMYIMCDLDALLDDSMIEVMKAHVTQRLVERTLAERGLVLKPIANGYEIGPKETLN